MTGLLRESAAMDVVLKALRIHAGLSRIAHDKDPAVQVHFHDMNIGDPVRKQQKQSASSLVEIEWMVF